MHPHRLDQNRPAILVVAGMVDVLEVERIEEAAPGVQVVVALQNIFAGVVELAVAEQESEAAELEIVPGGRVLMALVTKARPSLSLGRDQRRPE